MEIRSQDHPTKIPGIVLIAGSSGSGKTTATRLLSSIYPDKITAIHFDDFQHDVDIIEPDEDGYRNWDNLALTDFDFAVESIRSLKHGIPIQVRAKNEFDNPDFNLGNYSYRPLVDIIPTQTCVIEGHYSLIDERIVTLADLTIFLSLDFKKSTARRTKLTDEVYNSHYLEPAYKELILPSASKADHIIDVDELSPAEIVQLIFKHIHPLEEAGATVELA